MTAPAGVDLSLPSDQQLSAAAAPDPHTEAARLAAADPGRISELGRGFADAGTELDAVHQSSQLAQRRLAAGFHNNGAPVYDKATHHAALPPGFGDAGSHLHSLGRRLGAVSEELSSTIADADRELRRLQADLDARRRSWAAELETLGGRERLFPPEAIAGLLARRNTISAQMQDAVDTCGRAVAGRIARYTGVLNGCLQLLGEFTYLRPISDQVDTSGTRLDRALQPGSRSRPGAAPLTVPALGGPSIQIFPLPEGGRLEGTVGTPPAPSGPSIEINVPAPPADGRTGRGQLPPSGPPAVHIDANASAERPGSAGSPAPGSSAVSGGRTVRGDFPRTADAGETLVRRDGAGQVTNYQVYGPDGLPVKRVDVTGRAHGGIPTPHVIDYRRDVHPETGEVYVSPMRRARRATPEELLGL